MKRAMIGLSLAVLFFAMSASNGWCWERWHHREGVIRRAIHEIGWEVKEALGLVPRTYYAPATYGYGYSYGYSYQPVVVAPRPIVVTQPVVMTPRPFFHHHRW